MVKKHSPVLYVESIGFSNVSTLKTKNPPSVVKAFAYEDFNPEWVRSSLGKPSSYSHNGVFVFRLSKERAVRVNTSRKTVLLVSGKSMVRKLMKVSKLYAKES